MKKFYLEPNTKIVKINPRRMLMASETIGSASSNVDFNYRGGSTGEGRSRGVWDRWDE